MLRKLAIITALLGAFLISESSFAQVIIIAPGPPPRPRIERRIPPPSALHIWIGGCWTWVHGRWVWAPGHWEAPPRPGWMWYPGRWRHFRDGYHWSDGHWGERGEHGHGGHDRGNRDRDNRDNGNRGRTIGPKR